MAEGIVGEDAWVVAIQRACKSAKDLEARVEVVELYKQATSEEQCTMRLWLGYCQWVWSLHTDAQNPDAGWAEEEQLLGQELFGRETALAVWQQGAQATKFRIHDSHELWDRWMDIELKILENEGAKENIEHVRSLFEERLQVPHSAWDDTFQKFSSFITKYDEAHYEDQMVQTIKKAKRAKEQYAAREEYELGIQKAAQAKDEAAEWLAWKKYLDFEIFQNKKKELTFDLCLALHERALLRYGMVSAELWEDYADLIHQIGARNLGDDEDRPRESRLFSVLQTATYHCEWSAQLWIRCLLTAESDGLDFASLDEIKVSAMTSQTLDTSAGLEFAHQICAAWCGVLRRQSGTLESLFEEDDITLKTTRTSIQEVEDIGKRVYGKKNNGGDPNYRLEQALIHCLTERGLTQEAREIWKKLVGSRGASYEFWQRYYHWEINVWISSGSREAPSLATELLSHAVLRKNLDWPEKIAQMLVEHSERYEDAATIQSKVILSRSVMKGVTKRREREAAQATAAFQSEQSAVAVEAASPTTKRKRDSESDEIEVSAKKPRADENAPSVAPDTNGSSHAEHLKRDRENTSVLVTGLPAEVVQTKVRQYFKEYGHINNLVVKTDPDGLASTALIEFRSTDDVQSALLRDGKYFGESQIHVRPGTGLTLYVTNYPPTADDEYMRNLFHAAAGDIFSIRWPSLKYNTHRRFCYISFRTPEAAAAATALDGRLLEGRYRLEAKYSNPAAKKSREGAMNEGRELHVSNLDLTASEEDVRAVFAKYGTVESVRILRNVAGRSKGGGFVVFEQKDQAVAALALDKTKFRSTILTVELSSSSASKPRATTTTNPSKVPDDSATAPNESATILTSPQNPSPAAIANRTIALMNIPDTVNDARVRALAAPHGRIVKLVLRPDHRGAIVEFEDVVAAGKALLALDGYEIAPGRRLQTGTVRDLLREKEEIRVDRVVVGKAGGGGRGKEGGEGGVKGMGAAAVSLQASAGIRRPGGAKRGGLGVRRGRAGGTGSGASSTIAGGGQSQGQSGDEGGGGAEGIVPAKKSNADFARMFVRGKEEGGDSTMKEDVGET